MGVQPDYWEQNQINTDEILLKLDQTRPDLGMLLRVCLQNPDIPTSAIALFITQSASVVGRHGYGKVVATIINRKVDTVQALDVAKVLETGGDNNGFQN